MLIIIDGTSQKAKKAFETDIFNHFKKNNKFKTVIGNDAIQSSDHLNIVTKTNDNKDFCEKVHGQNVTYVVVTQSEKPTKREEILFEKMLKYTKSLRKNNGKSISVIKLFNRPVDTKAVYSPKTLYRKKTRLETEKEKAFKRIFRSVAASELFDLVYPEARFYRFQKDK